MRFGLRQLIFMLLLLAMPVAAHFYVFKPRSAQITEARREVVRKESKLKQLKAATKNIDDLGDEIDKLSSSIDLFEQKLPAKREVEVILQQVWNLASKHQLTPKSIRTDKPRTTSQYAELPIKLVIVGDFDGFYSFLLDLARLSRITRMPKMKLAKTNREEGKMQADVLLNIFYDPHQAQSDSTIAKGSQI